MLSIRPQILWPQRQLFSVWHRMKQKSEWWIYLVSFMNGEMRRYPLAHSSSSGSRLRSSNFIVMRARRQALFTLQEKRETTERIHVTQMRKIPWRSKCRP
jgi:hypothetical protein